MKWPAFQHQGETYDLTHLHSRTFRFERPAEGERRAELYNVDVTFSLHCFSNRPAVDDYDKSLVYPDSSELRLFNIQRYGLSKKLPDIIQTLPSRKPHHNGNRGNYFSIEMIDKNGPWSNMTSFLR